jgi:hypothetical protein
MGKALLNLDTKQMFFQFPQGHEEEVRLRDIYHDLNIGTKVSGDARGKHPAHFQFTRQDLMRLAANVYPHREILKGYAEAVKNAQTPEAAEAVFVDWQAKLQDIIFWLMSDAITKEGMGFFRDTPKARFFKVRTQK